MSTQTTSGGAAGADHQNSRSTETGGRIMTPDGPLDEGLALLNRERIPERVVHAKGWGAYGVFRVTRDISNLTRARIFSEVGKETGLLARFSTSSGESGAADAERDVRGFAVKFYTEEGNWDLVGSNTPVFFIRDPSKFADFVHTQKRHPKTNLRSSTAMWDFWSGSPETLHQITILMSDRGIPVAPMFMNGYGSHTFSFWNEAGERYWVKFHFKTRQGHRFYTNGEAEEIIGQSRESCQEELYGTIDRGEFPRWTVHVQIMPEREAENSSYNPFDVTKVWPQAGRPLIEIGEMELNRNPDDYFSEIEQAAFSPSNIVPGIGFSPDPVLQARLLAYPDAQRHRLGVHYQDLRVNAPECPVQHPHGQETPGYAFKNTGEPRLRNSSEPGRYPHRDGCDDYTQPRVLLHMFNEAQKARLFDNIAKSMEGVPKVIIDRQIVLFHRVDPEYAEGVMMALSRNAAFGRR